MSPYSRHSSHWWNSGRKKNRDGRGEDAKWTAPQTTAQTPDEELVDSSSEQSNHVLCDPALMVLTAGYPLSTWGACVDRLTAELVDRLTAKLVNRLTAKLVVRWACGPLDR